MKTAFNLKLGRKYRRLGCHLFEVSTYTYSTQSDPGYYFRMAKEKAEFILRFLGVRFRYVRDDSGTSNWRDWYGRPCSQSYESGHYEAMVSVKTSVQDLATAILAGEAAYYADKFGKSYNAMDLGSERKYLVVEIERNWFPVKFRLRSLLADWLEKADDEPLGHGFLWVVTKSLGKFLVGSIPGKAGHQDLLDLVRQDEDVTSAWINLD